MAEEIVALPRNLRYILIFFDRVGFPIVAFLIMCWLYIQMQNKMVQAVDNNTRVVMMLNDEVKSDNDLLYKVLRANNEAEKRLDNHERP